MEHFNFKKSSDTNSDNKQYFQLPTRKVSAMQNNTQEDANPHMAAFKRYSNINPNELPPQNYQNSVNNVGNYTPQTYQAPSYSNETNLTVKEDKGSLQHSLSANELRGQAMRKEEPGGMFKKKMNQFELTPPQNNPQPQKTFLLSPKARPPPPKIPSPTNASYKPAETVEPPRPTKMVKRVDSTVHETSEAPKEAPR